MRERRAQPTTYMICQLAWTQPCELCDKQPPGDEGVAAWNRSIGTLQHREGPVSYPLQPSDRLR